MSKYEPYSLIKRDNDTAAWDAKYRFENSYGASIIGGGMAYGGLELAVLYFPNPDDNEGWEIVYDTPVTDDVIGWLETADIEPLLDQIAALPAREASV